MFGCLFAVSFSFGAIHLLRLWITATVAFYSCVVFKLVRSINESAFPFAGEWWYIDCRLLTRVCRVLARARSMPRSRSAPPCPPQSFAPTAIRAYTTERPPPKKKNTHTHLRSDRIGRSRSEDAERDAYAQLLNTAYRHNIPPFLPPTTAVSPSQSR